MGNTLKEKLEALKKEAKDGISNPNLSLDERWELLIQNPELGNSVSRTDFNMDRDDDFLYDGPLYMEKYETRDVDSILEALIEADEFNITQEEIITFKQYCVDGCFSRMKFDW